MIEELQSFSPADVLDMDRLMRELAETSFCDDGKLGRVVRDGNSHLYILREEGRIVGCACLCVVHSPEFTLGFVESVTVLSSCRGIAMAAS